QLLGRRLEIASWTIAGPNPFDAGVDIVDHPRGNTLKPAHGALDVATAEPNPFLILGGCPVLTRAAQIDFVARMQDGQAIHQHQPLVHPKPALPVVEERMQRRPHGDLIAMQTTFECRYPRNDEGWPPLAQCTDEVVR